MLVLAAVLAAVLVTSQAGAAPTLDPRGVLDRAAPAVGIVRGTLDGRVVSGTAFVVDREGWLLTAAHVARRAQGLTVDLQGRGRLQARLVGYDATRDLALLRVTIGSPLPVLAIAAEPPRTGEPVAVLGAARGQREPAITTGAVTAIRATLPGLVRGIMIRSSAPARPGVSGGPLLNGRAQVVGLVVAVSFTPVAVQGSVAVSAQTIRAVLPSLRQGARVERAWIGVVGEPEGGARPRGASERGALVHEIVPGSPAASAGLRPGDVIVGVGAEVISDWEDLLAAVGDRRPGQEVRLTIIRSGQRLTIVLTLGVRP